MEKRILVVRFGDNDFGNSLYYLGRHLLDEVGEDVCRNLYERDHEEFNEILTRLFRSVLVLEQPRLAMYCRENGKNDLFTIMDKYLTNKHFILKDTEFLSTYEHEYDNSSTLVVDFINNKALTV